jgi:hypothetical protein
LEFKAEAFLLPTPPVQIAFVLASVGIKPVGCDARWTLMKDHGVKAVPTRHSSPVADVDDAVMIEPLGSRPLNGEIETVCATLVVHGVAFIYINTFLELGAGRGNFNGSPVANE